MEKKRAFSNGADIAPPPYSTTTNGQNQASDLGKLWSEAIQSYEKKTNQSLRLDPMNNLDEVVKGTEKETKGFGKFRHDKGKTDKVRRAFKDNLEWIQKVVKVAEVVGKAAGAFPPAMPAGLIFCAFGQVMNSFNDMSADYDKIVDFFAFVRRFFERLSIVEEKTPNSPGFLKAVVYVFSNMLEIFAIAQQYSKEQGRFKKWFKNLIDGEDPALKQAYSTMEMAVNELSDAVGMETLKTTAFIAELIHKLDKDVKVLVSTTTRIDEIVGITRAKSEVLVEKSDILVANQKAQTETLSKLEEMMKRSVEMPVAANEPDGTKYQLKKGKTDPSEKRRVALAEIKGCFNRSQPDFNMSAGIRARRINSSETEAPVNGTGKWLLEEGNYKLWASKDSNRLLWMQGGAGIGKSFLSETVVTCLEKSSTISSSCGSFFFRESEDGLSSFKNALCYLSVQIAENNSSYLEELASALDTTLDFSDPWKSCFAERFPPKGEAHAWLVLDGIDEVNETERKYMTECLANISKEGLNIHVLLVSRYLDEIEILDPLVINITKEKIQMDIQQVVQERMETLPHLSRFRKHVKRIITRKLKMKADGMLYVEHMLRRLNYIGREKAVLKDLDKNLPNSMEDLYKLILTEYQTNSTTEQYQIAKELFAWMAYSKRTLTREEAAHLCAITSCEKDFDIEDLVDEINGRSARLLEFNRGQDEEEVEEKADDKSQTSDADDQICHIESGKAPLSFQERSLREYFRVTDAEESGLRTHSSTAHLTIFETCGTLLLNTENELEDEKQPELLDYAAKYFSDHLIEININNVSDDEASRVLITLYKILMNFNNFARVMERFGNLYSEMASNENGTWINTVKKWAARYGSLNESVLAVEVAQWAREIITTEQPLMILARGHVLNSFKAYNGSRIAKAFEHARDAFQLSGFDVTSNTLETVLTIKTHFPDIQMDAGSYRAIACSLAEFQLPEESIKYINKAFHILPPGNSALKFYLKRSLFLNYTALSKKGDETGKKEWENAVKYIDEAISALPLDWKSSKELLDIVEYTYCEKAEHLIEMGKREEAIQAYEDCKAVRPGETDSPYIGVSGSGVILQLMVLCWDVEHDPDTSKTFKMMKGWTEEDILTWFGYIFGLPNSYDPAAIARLDQVAAKHGEEGKKFVLQCYHNFMETLGSKLAHNGPGKRDSKVPLSSSGAVSNNTILAKAATANLYRRIIRDDQKAKEIYVEILKHQSGDENLDLESIFFVARRALSEIMFEEFRTSRDPMKKATLLNEIKDYLTSSESDTGVFGIGGSNISIIFAIMHRVLGSATEFESTLRNSFDNCIRGLSDTVGWNDNSSFRLLSKVLACVEGLERDSLIALSCQYSKVTDQPAEENAQVTSEEKLEEVAGSETIEPKVKELTEENGQVTSEEKLEKVARHDITLEPNVIEPEKKNHNGDDWPESNTTIHLTEITTTTTTRDDGVLTSSTKTIVEEATFSPENPTSEVETEDFATPKDISKDAAKDTIKPYSLPPNTDEDLASFDNGGVECDGCGSSWSSWTEPQYLCIICTGTDLCTACHSEQVALKHGEQSTHCGIDHRYIKGPIEGWRGVKGGEMRILVDGEIEKIKVSVWLEELKERWNQAWEKFWKRLEGVKDLGF